MKSERSKKRVEEEEVGVELTGSEKREEKDQEEESGESGGHGEKL